MPVEFTVRSDDLRRAVRHFQVTRGEFAETDFADLTVTISMLGLKAVGTETAIATNGKQTGSARLPLKVLVRVVDVTKSYHQRESTIVIDSGLAKVGHTKVSHPDIVVGSTAFETPPIPPDASALDTLALASMMTPEQIANAGLRERVENAQKRASAAVKTSLAALKEFRVTGHDLTDIIDRRVKETAAVVRRTMSELDGKGDGRSGE